MEIPVSHPCFTKQLIKVQTAGFFQGARIMLNGTPIKHKKGLYIALNDSGEEVTIELKHDLIDPIPKIKIGDQLLELARPFKWYEYAWVGIPIILIFAGGALGAMVGVIATLTSAKIFRGPSSLITKYILTALITIVSYIVYMILAILAQHLIGAPK